MTHDYKNMIALIVAFLCFNILSGQDKLSGIIYYDQLQEFNLEGAYNSPQWDSYIAQLPKKGKTQYKLSFSSLRTLYEIDPEPSTPVSEKMKLALKKASYMKPPNPKKVKVYNDYNNDRQIEQIELLTKDFFIEKELEKLPWKITQTKKEVLGYMCLGAELEIENETITAYFSPQIPMPIGPGEYYGLPGAILSIEKNEEVLMVASSIQFWEEDAIISIQNLGEGQTISQKEFEKIVERKVEEYKVNTNAKMKKKGKK